MRCSHIPEDVHAREELIHCQSSKERIDTDDGRTLFLYALNVFLSAKFAISFRVGASQFLSADLLGLDSAALQKGGAAWLAVVHHARNGLDASLAVRHQLHSGVDVRDYVVSRDAIRQIATLSGVDATENQVAFRYTLDGLDGIQIHLKWQHTLAAAKAFDHSLCYGYASHQDFV